MPDAVLDTTRRIKVPPDAGVLPLLVPSVVVGVFVDRCCVADRVEVTSRLISATREVFSDDEGLEF